MEVVRQCRDVPAAGIEVDLMTIARQTSCQIRDVGLGAAATGQDALVAQRDRQTGDHERTFCFAATGGSAYGIRLPACKLCQTTAAAAPARHRLLGMSRDLPWATCPVPGDSTRNSYRFHSPD